MLKWFLISFGVIIAIIAAFLGTLYYLIFVKDVALARPMTYESEEAAVASGISDLLDGLLGIDISEEPNREPELQAIITGITAGTHDLDDLIEFISDPDTGVMATHSISLTGQRSLELNEQQLTALINLMLGSIDAFVDLPDEISSAEGALTYTIDGLGDIRVSGFGLNINDEDIAIVLDITLPQEIPYVGFLFGGKSISVGMNTPYTVAEDGTITFTIDPTGLKIGGISASWPGVSNLVNYLMSQFGDSESMEFSFNIVDPLDNALGSELDLEFSAGGGLMSFLGPEPLSAGMREIDYGGQTQEQVAADAQDDIDAFIAGTSDTLELTEEELTAVLAENVEDALEGAELGIDLDDFAVNVEDEGLVMTTTVEIPESTDLGLPEGSEIEVGLETEIVIVDGEPTLQITGFDLGGLPSETLGELGLDEDTLNDSLGESGIDLGEALGLSGLGEDALSLEEGSLTFSS